MLRIDDIHGFAVIFGAFYSATLAPIISKRLEGCPSFFLALRRFMPRKALGTRRSVVGYPPRQTNNPEIWYATNMEIHDYVEAYKSLIYSADGYTVYNPTLIDLWFDVDGVLYEIGSGKTLRIKE